MDGVTSAEDERVSLTALDSAVFSLVISEDDFFEVVFFAVALIPVINTTLSISSRVVKCNTFSLLFNIIASIAWNSSVLIVVEYIAFQSGCLFKS